MCAVLCNKPTSVFKCTRFNIIIFHARAFLLQLWQAHQQLLHNNANNDKTSRNPLGLEPKAQYEANSSLYLLLPVVYIFIRCFVFDSLRFLDSKGSVVSSSSVGPRLRPLQRDVTIDWSERSEAMARVADWWLVEPFALCMRYYHRGKHVLHATVAHLPVWRTSSHSFAVCVFINIYKCTRFTSY